MCESSDDDLMTNSVTIAMAMPLEKKLINQQIVGLSDDVSSPTFRDAGVSSDVLSPVLLCTRGRTGAG